MAEAADSTNVIIGPLAVAAAEYWQGGAQFRLAMFFSADFGAHVALDRMLVLHAMGVWPPPVSDRFVRRLPAMWAELRQLDNQVVSL